MIYICTPLTLTSSFVVIVGELYASEKEGSDESGDGTEAKPFKTILRAMRHAGKEPFPTIYVDSKEEGKVRKSLALRKMRHKLLRK